jgi:hypothetical protein
MSFKQHMLLLKGSWQLAMASYATAAGIVPACSNFCSKSETII